MKINLRLDVRLSDAKNIIMWLDNKDVTKYLNEDPNSASSLEEIINSGRADLLTYYLNRDARFFLIDTYEEKCVGYITLRTKAIKEYEIIIAIGNPHNWGKKIAYHSILVILNEVFFKWRINKLISKVHIDNTRSINLFKHLGFKETTIKNNHIIFAITFDEYLSYLKSN